MNNRSLRVGMLVAALAAWSAREAAAQITSASASGPGGTVTNLAIDTTGVTDDSISFDATFTSLAPITFTLGIDGPGTYYIGSTLGLLTNSTGSDFSSFNASLGNVPTGSLLNTAGWNHNAFDTVTYLPTASAPTSLMFNGPPGLANGSTTDIYTGVYVPASDPGPATIQVIWSPTALAAVPEPSTLVLGLIGTAAGLGYLARRHRV